MCCDDKMRQLHFWGGGEVSSRAVLLLGDKPLCESPFVLYSRRGGRAALGWIYFGEALG